MRKGGVVKGGELKGLAMGLLMGFLSLSAFAQEGRIAADDSGTGGTDVLVAAEQAEEKPVTYTITSPRCALGDRAAACANQDITETGRASWYGPGFQGKRTASGERFDMYALTAAHKTLPFGTVLRVRSLFNGREVDVKVNDRGPFTPNRALDLSRAAADALGMVRLGAKEVAMRIISPTEANLSVPASTPALTAAVNRPVFAATATQHRQNLRQSGLQRSLQSVRRVNQKHPTRR